MGFALLFIGLLMIVTGARGTYAQFGTQLASEFQGQNNFTYWIIALVALGALGYIKPVQTISRLLMTLVIIVLFLAHKGFFQQFQAALAAGPKQPNALPAGATTSSAGSSGFSVPSGVTSQGSNVGTGTWQSWGNWLSGLAKQGASSSFITPAQ
jgi:hypothetical protein